MSRILVPIIKENAELFAVTSNKSDSELTINGKGSGYSEGLKQLVDKSFLYFDFHVKAQVQISSVYNGKKFPVEEIYDSTQSITLGVLCEVYRFSKSLELSDKWDTLTITGDIKKDSQGSFNLDSVERIEDKFKAVVKFAESDSDHKHLFLYVNNEDLLENYEKPENLQIERFNPDDSINKVFYLILKEKESLFSKRQNDFLNKASQRTKWDYVPQQYFGELEKKLYDNHFKGIFITGEGSTGKSSLAYNLCLSYLLSKNEEIIPVWIRVDNDELLHLDEKDLDEYLFNNLWNNLELDEETTNENLAKALREEKYLLVLDNFENRQVDVILKVLAEFLKENEIFNLKILVTSRVSCSIENENNLSLYLHNMTEMNLNEIYSLVDSVLFADSFIFKNNENRKELVELLYDDFKNYPGLIPNFLSVLKRTPVSVFLDNYDYYKKKLESKIEIAYSIAFKILTDIEKIVLLSLVAADENREHWLSLFIKENEGLIDEAYGKEFDFSISEIQNALNFCICANLVSVVSNSYALKTELKTFLLFTSELDDSSTNFRNSIYGEAILLDYAIETDDFNRVKEIVDSKFVIDFNTLASAYKISEDYRILILLTQNYLKYSEIEKDDDKVVIFNLILKYYLSIELIDFYVKEFKCEYFDIIFNVLDYSDNLDIIKYIKSKIKPEKYKRLFLLKYYRKTSDFKKIMCSLIYKVSKNKHFKYWNEGESEEIPYYFFSIRHNPNLPVAKFIIGEAVSTTKKFKEKSPFKIENLKGQNILFYAAGNSNIEVIKYIFKYIKNKQKLDKNHENLLFEAIRSNASLENLRYLIEDEHLRTDIFNIHGDTILHEAARNLSLVKIKYLAQKAPFYNRKNKEGKIPLFIAASENKNPDVVAYLIENCDSTDSLRDSEGFNLIQCLANNENHNVAIYNLGKLNVKINKKPNIVREIIESYSSLGSLIPKLFLVSFYGNIEFRNFLIKSGDFLSFYESGVSLSFLIDWTRGENKSRIACLINSYKKAIVPLNVNSREINSDVDLTFPELIIESRFAIVKTDEDDKIIYFLNGLGANLNRLDENDTVSEYMNFIVDNFCKNYKALRAAMRCGLDISIKDENGRNLLHYLMMKLENGDNFDSDLFKILIHAGINPNESDCYEKKPVDYAPGSLKKSIELVILNNKAIKDFPFITNEELENSYIDVVVKDFKDKSFEKFSLEELLEKSENPDIQNEIGERYLSKQDFEESCKWFEKAAASGNEKGIINLAIRYIFGEGKDENFEYAFTLLDSIKELNHALGLYFKGYLLYYYHEDENKIEEGVSLIKKSANKGFGASMVWLIDKYEADLIQMDPCLYFRYIKALADVGWDEYIFKLSENYIEGYVGEIDIQQGISILKKISTEYAPAMIRLGDFYQCGFGMKQNFSKAFKLYEKESKISDDGVGEYELAKMIESGIGKDQSYERAFEYLKKSAEKKNPDAMLRIAEYYELGNLGKVEYRKAIEWYRNASYYGNEKAYEWLRSNNILEDPYNPF